MRYGDFSVSVCVAVEDFRRVEQVENGLRLKSGINEKLPLASTLFEGKVCQNAFFRGTKKSEWKLLSTSLLL